MPSPVSATRDLWSPSAPTNSERAREIRREIRAATRGVDEQQLHLAALLYEANENDYWADWGFDSFRQFVDEECGFGIRKAQQFVEVHRRFVVELRIPPSSLNSLGWSKLALVAGVIDQDNQSEVLEALDNSSYRKIKLLVQEIRRRTAAAEREADSGGLPTGDNWPNLLQTINDGSQKKDWLLTRPADNDFFVSEDDWEQLCYAVHHGANVLLTGPSGSGKSELCDLIAHTAGRHIERFNFGAMTEPRVSLIGNVHFDPNSGTRFVKSRFVNAVQRTGTVLLLDELSRAGRDAFNILLPLLDGQKYLALDEHEEAAVVHRADDVCFLATANLGMEYTGADALDAALKDRFPIQVAVDFPPPEKETEILLNRCPGLNDVQASRLVKLATRQREMACEGDFVGTISTRALLAAGGQLAAGVSMENAFRFCILNHFAMDGGDMSERARLRQIFQKDEVY